MIEEVKNVIRHRYMASKIELSCFSPSLFAASALRLEFDKPLIIHDRQQPLYETLFKRRLFAFVAARHIILVVVDALVCISNNASWKHDV